MTAASPKMCCAMRAKYLVGLIGECVGTPTPSEFPDFVLNWGGAGQPMVLGFKFCPWCGHELRGETRRVVHRGKQVG